VDASTVIDQYPVTARILLLAVIFASGYVEAFVWKSRALACATWFGCLGALTAWIAYSGTLVAIVSAAGVFTLGLLLLIAFYQFSESE
jgi:hypothetical protein